MFYGAPSELAESGQEVGATRAFLRSLIGLLRRRDVTHVACAFDHVIESFRNQLFDGYKTGEGIEPTLLSQFPLAEQAAAALGIHVWAMVEFEADDAIATGVSVWADHPEVEQVVICSPDKDLAQCVQGNRVVMWDRRRDRVLNHDAVVEKFGVDPSSIPDYLALVGDNADGIPGVPRWGAKSTAAVLSQYKKLENIPNDVADWTVTVRGAKALAENLASAREEVSLYRTLATLRTDVPIDHNLESIRWRGARRDQFQVLGNVLSDPDLSERVPVWNEQPVNESETDIVPF